MSSLLDKNGALIFGFLFSIIFLSSVYLFIILPIDLVKIEGELVELNCTVNGQKGGDDIVFIINSNSELKTFEAGISTCWSVSHFEEGAWVKMNFDQNRVIPYDLWIDDERVLSGNYSLIVIMTVFTACCFYIGRETNKLRIYQRNKSKK